MRHWPYLDNTCGTTATSYGKKFLVTKLGLVKRLRTWLASWRYGECAMSPKQSLDQNTIFGIFIITCSRKEVCLYGFSMSTSKSFMFAAFCLEPQKTIRKGVSAILIKEDSLGPYNWQQTCPSNVYHYRYHFSTSIRVFLVKKAIIFKFSLLSHKSSNESEMKM